MSWIKVATTDHISEGQGILVFADNEPIALFHIGGKFYAIDDACPHQGAPLSEGIVQGCVAVCPWHGAEFDVTNGKLLSGPGIRDVKSYPVRVEGVEVFVDVSKLNAAQDR